MAVRAQNAGTWSAWKQLAFDDVATSSANGLMSASDKAKLNGIASGANKYTHPGYTAHSSGLYKVTVDSTGHVSSVASVAKSDITALGIPGQDTNTTYSDATTSAHGLMSAADKSNLDSHITNKSNPHGVTAAQVGALPLSGGTMRGQILTSFKGSVAVGSYQAVAKTIPDLVNELRYSSGCMGSANITSSYGSMPAGWYNFIYIPHRSGGFNGAARGDNCDYGSLIMIGMTMINTAWIIEFQGGNIASYFSIIDTNPKSTTKSFTLSASGWSDWTQSISDSLITATSNQEVLPAIGISKEQLIAFQKAMIVDAGQSTGKFTLRVMGTLPTIDIPIRVIFRGTI